MKIKQGIQQLKQDIKDWYKSILAVMIFIFLTNLIFHNICTLVILTGLPCPGCGLTRAGISLLTLRWEDAWNYNCVIFLIVPLIIYWCACRYLFQCKCRGLALCLGVIGICLIVLYIYRMIYFFPNTPPMVYNENNLLRFFRNLFSMNI